MLREPTTRELFNYTKFPADCKFWSELTSRTKSKNHRHGNRAQINCKKFFANFQSKNQFWCSFSALDSLWSIIDMATSDIGENHKSREKIDRQVDLGGRSSETVLFLPFAGRTRRRDSNWQHPTLEYSQARPQFTFNWKRMSLSSKWNW